jgi:hypothetical protein
MGGALSQEAGQRPRPVCGSAEQAPGWQVGYELRVKNEENEERETEYFIRAVSAFFPSITPNL